MPHDPPAAPATHRDPRTRAPAPHPGTDRLLPRAAAPADRRHHHNAPRPRAEHQHRSAQHEAATVSGDDRAGSRTRTGEHDSEPSASKARGQAQASTEGHDAHARASSRCSNTAPHPQHPSDQATSTRAVSAHDSPGTDRQRTGSRGARATQAHSRSYVADGDGNDERYGRRFRQWHERRHAARDADTSRDARAVAAGRAKAAEQSQLRCRQRDVLTRR